jgi:DNA-directed RNA polymerase specialized sigma24 family protein
MQKEKEMDMNYHVQYAQSAHLSHSFIDHLLVKQALAGDQRAFEVLMNKYEQPLRSHMRILLKDQELTNDVLQAVFFQLSVSLPNLRTTIPLKAWLYRVAYHRCLDELRTIRHEIVPKVRHRMPLVQFGYWWRSQKRRLH